MQLYLIGGLLGSGKTTAIHTASNVLQREGRKVAVVTNDQGDKLVDTAYIQSSHIDVTQITGGCFCCRYNELESTLDALAVSEMPDIIFAESVGSCTDLIATVAKPLAVHRPEINIVISVFADAMVLLALLKSNASFLNDKIRYIYKKQLEEADILVVNKVDLLTEDEILFLENAVASEYEGKQLLFQNSLNESNIRAWLQTIDAVRLTGQRTSLDIEYDTYASGEAMMAWLDAEIEIESVHNNAGEIANNFIHTIHSAIREKNFFIGHLKFLVDDGFIQQKISFTATDVPEKSRTLQLIMTKRLQLLINARVQASPAQIQEIISSIIKDVESQDGIRVHVKSLAAFQPNYPRPVHRIAE